MKTAGVNYYQKYCIIRALSPVKSPTKTQANVRTHSRIVS
jgi:hypothetical protein